MAYGNKKYLKKDIVFDIFNYAVLAILCLTTLYPFLYIVSVSFTGLETASSQITLIPRNPNLMNYVRVFSSEYILTGFRSTLIRTILGTLLSLVFCTITAYPLAQKELPDRGFWTGFIVFTMFFSGGLIPEYMLVRNLGLIDSYWALILPGLVPTFSMIIMRNFFMTISPSLKESARIDGANDIQILVKIILPLSLPIITTVILWTSVAHWNSWFDCMIYVKESRKQVLQIILRRIILEGTQQVMDMNSNQNDTSPANPEGLKAASIMITSLPIIAIYPFVQKYFVKGVMVGSLKG